MPNEKAPAHRAIRSNLAVALSLSIHGALIASSVFFARNIPLIESNAVAVRQIGESGGGEEKNKDGYSLLEIDSAVKRASGNGGMPKDERGGFDILFANSRKDMDRGWDSNPLSGYPPELFVPASQKSAAGSVMALDNPAFKDIGNLLSLTEKRPETLPVSDGPPNSQQVPGAKPGSVAAERRTVAELEALRGRFISQLVRDMSDDPEGNLHLGSMGFIDFFIRSWYLDNAIERIGSGKQPDASEQELQAAFGRIRGAAESRVAPTDSPLVRIKKFHAAMTSYFDGYEAKHADIYSALIRKVVNCNSSTEVGTAGYVSSDRSVMLNWFSADPANGYDAHVQSALLYNGRYVTIENTTRASPLRYHHGGALTKPEAFVIKYLVSHGTSFSQLPKEASQIIDAIKNAPKSVMKAPSGYLAYQGAADFSSSLDIIDRPITPSSAPFSGVIPSGAGDGSRSPGTRLGTRNTKSPPRLTSALTSQSYLYMPFTRNEKVKMAVATAKLYLQNFDFASESQKIEDLHSGDEMRLTCLARRMLDVAAIMRGPSALERLGLYERIRNSRKRPVGQVMPERDVLDPSVRDADPVSGRMGLLGDLIGEGEDSGWSGPMPVVFPKADYQALASGILDNKILLYSTDFPAVVKSIHLRSIALTRAEAFGGLDGSHSARSQRRADMLLQAIAGEKVEGIDSEFAGHYGFTADVLVPIEKMAKDNGRTGISLLALEDIISFRGEKAAVDAVTAYMGRKDVKLGRIGYERLLLSFGSRMIFEGGPLRSSLSGLLDDGSVRIEAKAAIAHFLFEKGSQDERIPKILSKYLMEADVIPSDAISLAGHGLDRKKIGGILNKKLDIEAHSYEEMTYRYLVQNEGKGDGIARADGGDGVRTNTVGIRPDEKERVIEKEDIIISAKRLFDSFETLMMLGFRDEALGGIVRGNPDGSMPSFGRADFIALAARYGDTSHLWEAFNQAQEEVYDSTDFNCFGQSGGDPSKWTSVKDDPGDFRGLMRVLPKWVDIDKVSREGGGVPAFITYPNELLMDGRGEEAKRSYIDYMSDTYNFTPNKPYMFTTEMEGLFWESVRMLRVLRDDKTPGKADDEQKRLDDAILRRARSLASEGICPIIVSPFVMHMMPMNRRDFSGFIDETIRSEMLHDLMGRHYSELLLIPPEYMDKRCRQDDISFVAGREALDKVTGFTVGTSTRLITSADQLFLSDELFELINILRPHKTLRNDDIMRLIARGERRGDQYHAALFLAVKGYLDFDSHGDVTIIHPPKPIRAKNK